MFGKLKEKLKGALNIFSKKVKDEGEEIKEEPPKVEEKKIEKKKPQVKKEQPKPKSAPKKKESEKKVEKAKEISTKPKPTKESVTEVVEEKEEVKKEPEVKVEKAIHKEAQDLKEEIALEKEKEEVQKISEPTIKEEALEDIAHEEQELEKDIQKQEEVIVKEEKKKKGFLGGLFGKKDDPPKEVETIVKEEQKTSVSPETPEDKEVKEKKSIFSGITDAITKKKISADKFEELFQELEIILLENNTSFEVVEKIKEDLSKNIVDKPLPRNEIDAIILESLKTSISSLFEVPSIDLVEQSNEKKPLVISFIGVNGSGKTTQLAKVANYFQKNGKTCVMAACDTFRAAAIQQLEEHANNLDIKLIKHDYGADAAAVAYDAIEHAKAKDLDVVLLDTAGRLHSNSNLMEELRKLIRIANPDINIFVGESITGNDAVYQATEFSNEIDVNGIILTKADVDDKGGTAISISYVTGKPILFLGKGQEYDDIEVFDKEALLKNLGL